MFFKDIYEWSKVKLRTMRLLFWILYYIASTVVPVIIIASRYTVFSNRSGFSLKGWALIGCILIAMVGCKKVYHQLTLMADVSYGDRIFKYTALLVIALIIPAIAIYVLFQLKTNFEYAWNTITMLIIPVTIGIIIEYVFCKPLDSVRENQIKAEQQVAINTLADNLKRKK